MSNKFDGVRAYWDCPTRGKRLVVLVRTKKAVGLAVP
jgi:hypothetical protein